MQVFPEKNVKMAIFTLSDDPIMMRRSASCLSMATDLWNSSPKPSPKKTMSGFMMPLTCLMAFTNGEPL